MGFVRWTVLVVSLLLAPEALPQERILTPGDEDAALNLLSWGDPSRSDDGGWRALAGAGLATAYNTTNTGQSNDHGASQTLWGRLSAGLWGGRSFLHTNTWAAVSLVQGANPRFQPTTPTQPFRAGHLLEADLASNDPFGVRFHLRIHAGYEGQGPNPSQLFGPYADTLDMTGASPFGFVGLSSKGGLFYADQEDREHRWLYVGYDARRIQHLDPQAPASGLTEHSIWASIYGQRFLEEGFRDTGFDVLPMRFAATTFDQAVRPNQQWLDLRLAQGRALIHGNDTTFHARAHLGWRFINDGQRTTDTITIHASLATGIDRPNWGLALDATRSAAPGPDSAGLIAQDQFQGRLDLHPLQWPVAFHLSAAYGRLSDLETDLQTDDDEDDRPHILRWWTLTGLTWTAWSPWFIGLAWTTGEGPTPDRNLWRPWATPTQGFNEVTLSLSWQPILGGSDD